MKGFIILIVTLYGIASLTAIPTEYKSDNLVDEIDPEQLGDYFEGDMMLDDEQLQAIMNPRGRNIIIGDRYRWENAVVHYEFGPIFKDHHTALILQAFDVIQQATCIRFYPKTETTKDYIQFTGKPTGCHSAVGRKRGEQTLNLKPSPIGRGCFKLYKIVHEIVHALGFYHQQSASDRDHFVTIVEKNIQDGKFGNFKKFEVSRITDLGIPYDYDSVMHYGPTTFSKNGEPTIIPHDPNAKIGQRERLSEKDIAKLNMLYCRK